MNIKSVAIEDYDILDFRCGKDVVLVETTLSIAVNDEELVAFRIKPLFDFLIATYRLLKRCVVAEIHCHGLGWVLTW